jgi:hypothetical protein
VIRALSTGTLCNLHLREDVQRSLILLNVAIRRSDVFFDDRMRFFYNVCMMGVQKIQVITLGALNVFSFRDQYGT